MMVYIVETDVDDGGVLSIWSSRELAENEAERYKVGAVNIATVREIPLDVSESVEGILPPPR